jgi:hypothetical protein
MRQIGVRSSLLTWWSRQPRRFIIKVPWFDYILKVLRLGALLDSDFSGTGHNPLEARVSSFCLGRGAWGSSWLSRGPTHQSMVRLHHHASVLQLAFVFIKRTGLKVFSMLSHPPGCRWDPGVERYLTASVSIASALSVLPRGICPLLTISFRMGRAFI